MENSNENEDLKLNKQRFTELFKKSAALKKKNNIVMEKLRILKKMSDQLLKTGSIYKR
ncbi:hypothetical protein [Pedobacter heparinus]|uniref:hypothetical protein n=1 Tax=Pedobacter heparinus TaxID=984 RepID=UPI00292EBA7D|nr:hypothetical protein [Pedobacter heparinus]